MICPNCNANLPDGSGFCTNCGAQLEMPKISAKKRGLKKSQFLKTEATPAIKKCDLAAKLIFIVLAALIIIATITTNTISIMELPIVTLAIEEDDREAMTDEMEKAYDELKETDIDELIEEVEEEYDKKTARLVEDLVDQIKNATKKISLNNTVAMINSYEKLIDKVNEDVINELELNELYDTANEMSKVLGIVQYVIYGLGAVALLLTLWAAFGKKTGLCVLCILFYVPICALLSSTLIALLCFVAYTVLAVFTSRVNKAWKKA